MPSRVMAVVIGALAGLASPAGQTSAGPVTSSTVFARDNAGKPVPRFANGYTIFFDRANASIAWFDGLGKPAGPVELKLPGEPKITIADVTANKSGMVVVAVHAAEGTPGDLLFWLHPEGRVERIVRTTPFVLRRVTFSPTGSLWALGSVTQSADPDPHTLREYDTEGRLMRRALPKSLFPAMTAFVEEAMLAAGPRSLVLYAPAQSEYVECDWTGTLVKRWKVTPAWTQGGHLVGLGFSADGTLYAGGIARGSEQRPFVFALDRASSRWRALAVPDSVPQGRLITLLGVDGQDLIFYGQPASIHRVPAK